MAVNRENTCCAKLQVAADLIFAYKECFVTVMPC